jgi:hypothetical protein
VLLDVTGSPAGGRSAGGRSLKVNLNEAVGRFCSVARTEMLKWLSVQSCIHSTAVTLNVFQTLGFKARELPVAFVVENSRLKSAYVSGLSKKEKRRARKKSRGWIDAIPDEGEGWEGHLVALVGEAWWVDSSFDQSWRVWGSVWGSVPIGKEILALNIGGEDVNPEKFMMNAVVGIDGMGNGRETRLKVMYISRPDNVQYLKSEAWRDPAIPMIAGRIVSLMNGIPVPEKVEFLAICREDSGGYVTRKLEFDPGAGIAGMKREVMERISGEEGLRAFQRRLVEEGKIKVKGFEMPDLGVLEMWM